MKRFLYSNLLTFDVTDVILLSWTVGGSAVHVYKWYRNRRERRKNLDKGIDPIVIELKETAPRIVISDRGKPITVPTYRGGDDSSIRAWHKIIESRRLGKIICAIAYASSKHRKLVFIGRAFCILNNMLTVGTGLRFALGGYQNGIQIVLIAFTSTTMGAISAAFISSPLVVLIPVGLFFGRGIEVIADPYEECRLICRMAEQYHNQRLLQDMPAFTTMAKKAAIQSGISLDEFPLLCVEEQLSLVQRYRLKQVIETPEGKKAVKFFAEFIKQFKQCDPNPEEIYQNVVGTAEKLKVLK